MIILGIETSCDETACGIVEDGKRLLSNAVLSSMNLHVAYGGVVPEIAARSHIESIIPVIEQALTEAFLPTPVKNNVKGPSFHISEKQLPSKALDLGCERTDLSHLREDLWDRIDGIAVTYGAGLGGSLLVGVMTARTLAIAKNKPLYAINHVEAHIYANFITELSPSLRDITQKQYVLPNQQPRFPLLGLIVSGGHSQLVLWRDHFDYTLLGQTHDDAIGEAFDKVAKLLGLPYPGGPSIALAAKKGDPFAFQFPKAKMPGKYDYSFSGPKTAVLRAAQELIGEKHDFPSFKLSERLSEAQKANIAASFQRIAVETVVDKTMMAYQEFQPKCLVIGGGVAASSELRIQLESRLHSATGSDPIAKGLLSYQDPRLMTDNGAMIATLGCYKAQLNQPTADPYSLDIAPNLSM